MLISARDTDTLSHRRNFPRRACFIPCIVLPGIRTTLSFVYKCPGLDYCLSHVQNCPGYELPYNVFRLELRTTQSKWLELPEYGLPCPMLGKARDTDYFILRLELPAILSYTLFTISQYLVYSTFVRSPQKTEY
jgi:hypothetical protein